MQEDPIDDSMVESIENILRHTSGLDAMQFTQELTRRRNELHLSRTSSPTECAPSGSSSATLYPNEVVEDENPDKNTTGVLLEPFGRLRLHSEGAASTSFEPASAAVECKDSRTRSMTL